MREPLEVILPDATPEYEWILGRAVQKMSPRTRHALLQGRMLRLLDDWAAHRYLVGTEWCFRLAPPGEIRRPLVPDVAVVPRHGLRGLTGRDFDSPPFAPLIVVEIRAPGDRDDHLAHKREVYFACGTLLMLVVDPLERTVTAAEMSGAVALLREHDTLTSSVIPGLRIVLRDVFAAIDIPT